MTRDQIAARLFAADLRACTALEDERRARNAAARARCRANVELVAWLEADARRRGVVRPPCHLRCAECLANERADIEKRWTEYFRNIDVNYP